MKSMAYYKIKIVLVACIVLVITFTVVAQKVEIGKKIKGSASYYHKKFNGRKTASGERLNNQDYTCAHRFFPFGTMLEIVNPSNGKWVVVRVNDRGPFSKNRVIDLSFSAAKQLGMIQKGILKIEGRVIGEKGELCILKEGALSENLKNIFNSDTTNKFIAPLLPKTVTAKK